MQFIIISLFIALNFFIHPSVNSILMIIDWIPIFFLFNFYLKYITSEDNDKFLNTLKYSIFLLPLYQNYFKNYYFSLNVLIQIVLSILFVIQIYYKRKETSLGRDFYLKSCLILSFIFINQIWNALLYFQLHTFFVQNFNLWQTLNNLDSINLTDLFIFNQFNSPQIKDILNQIHYDFIVMKITMIFFWLVSWGGLYFISKKAHNKTLFFNQNYKLVGNHLDWILFIISFIFMCFRVYEKTHFEIIFLGIWALYFIHAVLLFMVIFLWQSLFCEIKNKPFYLIRTLTFSIFLIASHLFEFLHDFLSQYPDIYFFANHGTPSFGTALSFTYIGDLLIVFYSLFLIFYFIKKFKFSINFLMINLSFYSLFFIVFMTHHFIIVHTVNNADELFENTFSQIIQKENKNEFLNYFNENHFNKINVTDFKQLKGELEKCYICKINVHEKIDFTGIENELLKRKNEFNTYPILAKKYNLKLVYISTDKNGNIYSALRLSNYISFFIVFFYSLFYLIILSLWLVLIYFTQKLHFSISHLTKK